MEQRQIATFTIDNRVYGIDVMRVQEVLQPMAMTKVRLAPDFVGGLINLRGQVITAIHLRHLLVLGEGAAESMNVVCRAGELSISLLVDQVGDVIEVDNRKVAGLPGNVDRQVKRLATGVFKAEDSLITVLDVDHIVGMLNQEETSLQERVSNG